MSPSVTNRISPQFLTFLKLISLPQQQFIRNFRHVLPYHIHGLVLLYKQGPHRINFPATKLIYLNNSLKSINQVKRTF